MTDLLLSDLEVAPPSVVRQAARDFAMALAGTPQFRAFEAAQHNLRQDQAAQRVIGAYQSKQRVLRMALRLGTATPEERAQLEDLRQAFVTQPSIAALLQVQSELMALCQATASMLSEDIGLDFAGACKKGCC